MPSGETWSSETTPRALDALVPRLLAQRPTVVVVEATGGYEAPLVAQCAAAGLPIAVVNPRQVRAFAQAVGRTAKTDPIDAALLALFAVSVPVAAELLPSPPTLVPVNEKAVMDALKAALTANRGTRGPAR